VHVKLLSEHGYDEAALGFSLSYNTTVERAKQLLPKYAFKNNGENKFLRAMVTWWDITAPRFWLTELDTYKVSTTRLSESTMHMLTKRVVTNYDFEYPLEKDSLDELNNAIRWYNDPPKGEEQEYKKAYLPIIKNYLPEGYLQRIIFFCSYATLQTIYNQREHHRLPQWKMFLYEILGVSHPEFIR
jgi:hypothetical protein